MADMELYLGCEHKVVVEIPGVPAGAGRCSSCGLSLNSQDWLAMGEPSGGLRRFVIGEPFWR
jgi:hypothetical protein